MKSNVQKTGANVDDSDRKRRRKSCNVSFGNTNTITNGIIMIPIYPRENAPYLLSAVDFKRQRTRKTCFGRFCSFCSCLQSFCVPGGLCTASGGVRRLHRGFTTTFGKSTGCRWLPCLVPLQPPMAPPQRSFTLPQQVFQNSRTILTICMHRFLATQQTPSLQ